MRRSLSRTHHVDRPVDGSTQSSLHPPDGGSATVLVHRIRSVPACRRPSDDRPRSPAVPGSRHDWASGLPPIGHRRWSAADPRPSFPTMRRFLGTAVADWLWRCSSAAPACGRTRPARVSGADGWAFLRRPDSGAHRGRLDEDRQVVTTATAFLAVEDPADGAQEVSELVESVGGRVDERSEQAASGGRRARGRRRRPRGPGAPLMR